LIKPAKLGHLVLRVRDLERSQQFYTEVLGLEVTTKIPGRMVFLSASGDASHELALMGIGPDAPGPDANRVGLYHFAWQMESLADLQEMYRRFQDTGVRIGGIGDHGISLGVYIFDPDGNEIEVFYELPRGQWPKGDIFSGSFPGNLEEAAVS
jgi:catechol 2,3-dioxygenase